MAKKTPAAAAEASPQEDPLHQDGVTTNKPEACTCKAGRYSVSQAGCRPGTIDRTVSCLVCGATSTLTVPSS